MVRFPNQRVTPDGTNHNPWAKRRKPKKGRILLANPKEAWIVTLIWPLPAQYSLGKPGEERSPWSVKMGSPPSW